MIVTDIATETHQGEIMGVPPTGRSVEVDGVFVYCVEDGRLTAGTDMWDVFGLLAQIGGLPGQFYDDHDWGYHRSVSPTG